MKPRWLSVPGYEDLYEVSDDGQVRGLKTGKILKPLIYPSGHRSVTLSTYPYKRQVGVHRLVLLAFVGPPPLGTEARHYPNRDPADNRLENLSWAPRVVNVRDRVEHGTDNSGERHRSAVLTWETVREIRAVKHWPQGSQTAMAKKLGVTQSRISSLIRGKGWIER